MRVKEESRACERSSLRLIHPSVQLQTGACLFIPAANNRAFAPAPTTAHGPPGANETGHFGVRPTVVPYVLTTWFGSQISISHTVEKKANNDLDAWLFVISKNVEECVLFDKSPSSR